MTTRALARLLLAAPLLLIACDVARAETAARAAIRVVLTPDMVDRMSGIAWRALKEECNGIWTREGVELVWAGPDARVPSSVVLPLAFDDREVRRHDPRGQDAFGVTLFAGRSQRIVVSIARAQRVVAHHHGLADTSNGMSLDIATGRLLGRVVAHEIGHALLLSMSHSVRGLMNPQLDAADVRPLVDGAFALTTSERERLAVRFSFPDAPEPRADVRRAASWEPAGAAAASFEATAAEVTWRNPPPAPVRPRAPR